MMNTQCVVREVNPGDSQFVLVSDVVRRMGSLVPGESVYVGRFNGRSERCGMYGSDTRMVCLPAGRLETVSATDAGQVPVLQ